MLLLLFLFCAFSTMAHASSDDYLIVTESWDGDYIVNFSIDTNYTDLIGFAVGTNFSYNFGAQVDFDASHAAPEGWTGVAAVKHGGTNWERVEYNPFPITYDDLPDFIELDTLSGYNSAFVFYYTSTPGVALNPSFTNGFSGYAFNNDSTFVAFTAGGEVITGETSVVPIPGAAILLFSGLIGVFGIRRKK
jgi:hypothetical protein